MSSRYTIQELSDLSGFARRTIRYYVEKGLIEPPAGRGRGGFYYDSQLSRLLAIRTLQEQGLRLSAIAERLRSPEGTASKESAADVAVGGAPVREEWVQYEIAPWLRLEVRRDAEDAAEGEIELLLRAARAAVRRTGGTQ